MIIHFGLRVQGFLTCFIEFLASIIPEKRREFQCLCDFHGCAVSPKYVLNTLEKLLKKDSPSGFCYEIMDMIGEIAGEFAYSFERTSSGCGIITVAGQETGRVIGLTAHVDTLGAMVRSVTDKGTLKFALVGSPIVPTLDSEYCKVRTRAGKVYTGTFLSTSPAAHVYEDNASKIRDPKNMEIRLDEKVKVKEDALKLGIGAGDYIFIDPKTVILENGFVKSRFLDDKGSVACLMGLLEWMYREKVTPKYTLKLLISVYEEVGHGTSYIPKDITELIAVDMGCIGDDLGCTEYDVSICAKDSSGPYDYNMVTKLVDLAKENELSFVVDIYPYYNSDVGAAIKGGHDIKGALIGPGVHASHGMERTHVEALENTMKLLMAYVMD